MTRTADLPLESKYRLRSVLTPKLKDQERRRQQSRWNGNGQGATNDSNDYKAAVRIIEGFPVEYSCLDDPREKDIDEKDVHEISVTFDYEMISRKTADVDKSMRSLEWSLLWNVARNLGLHNCNYRKQEPLFDTRRQLQAVTSYPSSESFVVGLSSLDFDRVDYETKRCTFLNNAVDERTICTPMLGTMTAHFTGAKDTITNYLKKNIEQEMNSRRVRIEEVKECRYIGERKHLRQNASTRETLGSKTNSTSIALVFGVLAGVFMLCFALLMARGRRRRQEAVLDDNEDDLHPVPVPPIIFEKEEVPPNPDLHPSTSGDTQESVPDRVEIIEDVDEEKGLQPVSVASIIAGEAPLPDDSDQPHSLDDGTGTSTPQAAEDKETTVDLPHLPPVFVVPVETSTTKEPVESKTLKPKRKRRKKKKKKQRVLQRVSSKQSINEMETINEMDEGVADDVGEGSEFDGSEYSASEYSTDDEDDALLMANTPIESGSEDANSPKVSPGPAIPPSPIREEPRIKRIPPPWI